MSEKCTATTATGEPCQAWAVRGSSPPLCSAHAGRNVGAGAPTGNRNARTHGAYSDLIDEGELAQLVADAGDRSLEDELAITRLALRRLTQILNDDEAQPSQIQAIAPLIFTGSRAVARLLRADRALSGEAADGLNGAISQAIDELMNEWNIPEV